MDEQQNDGSARNERQNPDTRDLTVVGIGASAGGVTALKSFFARVPPDCGMAFVVILHLSPEHESNLDKILQTQTPMPVIQVTETVKIEPNKVFVIPPAKHLEMVDGVIRLVEPEKKRGARVPIDLFFRTLAEAHGKQAIAVVLSGTGSDGTLGMKRVKELGGIAVAQSPDDAEYDLMPRAAIAANVVDVVLPVAEIPQKLVEMTDCGDSLSVFADSEEKVAEIASVDALREILALLRVRTGHDFSHYKQPTVLRRIARRLQVQGLSELAILSVLGIRQSKIETKARELLCKFILDEIWMCQPVYSFDSMRRINQAFLFSIKVLPPGQTVDLTSLTTT